MLSIEPVTQDRWSSYVAYCHRYGSEHDESFLPDEEFAADADQPSFLLRQSEQAVGAVSLMRHSRFRQVGKGRFAIFHSTLATPEAYGKLLEAIRPHFKGLGSVYLFLPESRNETAAIFREFGFEIERYSYVLIHPGEGVPEPCFPDGMSLKPLHPGDEAGLESFAALINLNFGHLAGHTHASAETTRQMFSDSGFFPGGIAMLFDGEQAIGTLAVMREYDDPHAAEVMAFSLAPEYRGLGLGRALLRASMHLGIQAGLKPIYLSVNAENKAAVNLYLSEGFQAHETMVCYTLDCTSGQS